MPLKGAPAKDTDVVLGIRPEHFAAAGKGDCDITVNVDDRDTRILVSDWEESDITVPLKVLASPYREITRPIINYVRRLRRESPRDVITVFIPEYVVEHWWERLLHNGSATHLKARLLFMPGVVMVSVPWQLGRHDEVQGTR